MPEGDTVWLTARQQHAALSGALLTGCDLRVPRLAAVDLSGEPVHAVVARGKHLLHRIGEWSLHSHLRMEGSWRLFPADGRGGHARWTAPAHTARAVLTTTAVQSVGFSLGLLELVPAAQEQQLLDHLGPDLLGPDWDPAEAVRRLAADPATPVFVAIQDQRRLAGIGNVYANELCFLRGLAPARPAGEVIDELPALVELAHRLLHANKGRWTRSTTGDLRRGRTSWVYGRAGEPCRRCGTPLRRDELGRPGQERGVAWCPACQPGGRQR